MTQTVASDFPSCALGLATNHESNVVDRIRTLSMPRLWVMASCCTSGISIGAMWLAVATPVGFIIGWRIDDMEGPACTGHPIALLVSYAISWAGSVLGLIVRSLGTTQSIVTAVIFWVCFISSASIRLGMWSVLRRDVVCSDPLRALARPPRQAFGNAISFNARLSELRSLASMYRLWHRSFGCLAVIATAIAQAVELFRRGTQDGT